MRRILLLFCLAALFSVMGAQTITKFYAIDGTEWVTKYDRDRKEKLLWDKVNLNLKAALVSGKFGEDEANAKTYHEALTRLFNMCKESIATLRAANQGKGILQNAEFRYFLSENGVKARIGVARNNEVFNLEEYANCFDEVLREYTFNSEIMEELGKPNGRTYNISFLVGDFAERMNQVISKIERELLAMEFKEGTILQLVPRYEAAKRAVEQRDKKQQEKRKQKQ